MQSNKTTSTLKRALIALTFGIGAATAAHAAEPVALTHIHGLSYSADGSRLMIPSHHGLAGFENGRWSKAPGPAHDYMGFSGTRDTLYSSGHPAPGSGLTNPFGLIKSGDGGKTWQKLGLEGESDFHNLATSYGTNAVYVVNHGPNSRMSQSGIFRTRNDGLKWTQAAAKGLDGELRSLAFIRPTPLWSPWAPPTGCIFRAIRPKISSGSQAARKCSPKPSISTPSTSGTAPMQESPS